MKSYLKAEQIVVGKALKEIRDQTSSLQLGETQKLESALGDLELKISALRSFIWNHLIRNGNKN